MTVKITVVCENTVTPPMPFIGEHGLSFLIEEENDTTLFDTGQGLGIVHNMRAMGKKPDAVKRIILSHGHYDHTGGLMPFLTERGAPVPVYCHADAFGDKRAVIPLPGADPLEVPIGMRATREELTAAGAEFHSVEGLWQVTDTVRSLSAVTRPCGWKGPDARLKVRKGDALIDDPFDDDLSLLLETASGPVAVLGCAHAGIVEILDEMARLAGITRFHAVLGGTHLESASPEYIDHAVEALRRYQVACVGVSHCTGFRVACRLAGEFPGEFRYASAGTVFEF